MYALNEKTWKRIRLNEVDSTNLYAKGKRTGKENLLITAVRQTGGRGTKGRSFSSEEGGVYLSRLTFYEDFPVKEAFTIMIGCAVAVCETLAFYGMQPKIKWPNDILVGGKKICGILIENTFSGGNISSSVVGIGVNVSNALPTELLPIATTIWREGKTPSTEEVTERLVSNLCRAWTMEDYRRYLGFVGEEITLLIGEERIPATLLSVTDEGELEVKTAAGYRRLASGEVSVRV